MRNPSKEERGGAAFADRRRLQAIRFLWKEKQEAKKRNAQRPRGGRNKVFYLKMHICQSDDMRII